MPNAVAIPMEASRSAIQKLGLEYRKSRVCGREGVAFKEDGVKGLLLVVQRCCSLMEAKNPQPVKKISRDGLLLSKNESSDVFERSCLFWNEGTARGRIGI